MHRRTLLQGLAAAPLASAAWAEPAPKMAALNGTFHDLVDQAKLAGVVLLVAQKGKLLDLDAYGRLNAALPAPVQTDSIFRIASMTKPITGAAMMMLWEEGKWAFDDPVARHIPEFAGLKVKAPDGSLAAQKAPMTMRQLNSHTAGFDRLAGYDMRDLQSGDLQGMVDKLARLPLAFQPGEEWRYGPSVDLQGYIVQKLSGVPFDQFLQQRLFGPLGMKDTGFWVDPAKVPRTASIHGYLAGRIIPLTGQAVLRTSRPSFISGAGGLFSTAPDYWRFTQMILDGGQAGVRRYLKPETVRLMHANVLKPGVNVTLYSPDTRGLGFGVDFAIVMDQAAARTAQPQNAFYWGGAFGTWFWIDPDRQLIVIGMIQNLNGTIPTGPTPGCREISARAVYEALGKRAA